MSRALPASDPKHRSQRRYCRQTGGAETSWNSSMTYCGRGYEAQTTANMRHVDANVHVAAETGAIWQISPS
ncbi:protein of unknown function [Serratia sp. Tan611]|nr:protein of unknown function [Serratia sp. Tan611]